MATNPDCGMNCGDDVSVELASTKRITRLTMDGMEIPKICRQRLEVILQSKEAQVHQTSRPKIQRAPDLLRQNADFAKYCSPKLISIGPIHHHLKLGEKHKLMWTAIHVEEYGREINNDQYTKVAYILLKRIEENIQELKKLFSDDAIRGYNDKDLAWMLFVDGCSVLQFMEKIDNDHPEALKLKIDQLFHIFRDLGLLENQIPFRVLELLTKGVPRIEDLMIRFFSMGDTKCCSSSELQGFKPTHLLHLARSMFLLDFSGEEKIITIDQNQQNGEGSNEKNEINTHQALRLWQTYKNLRDLKAAGIRVKSNRSLCWNNISFTSKAFSGELKLPRFIFNEVTPYFFRNLIAYEACPDFQNNFGCSSYLAFMDSLIDDAEDVKELRLAGVIQNFLANDQEVAELFNALSNDLVAKMFNFWSSDVVAYSWKYIRVKHQIEMHYKNKYRTWMAEIYNTHFNTPWTIFAFLAAILAIVLTLVQTWFAIYPKK